MMAEHKKYPSKIHEKHPNSKFAKGSKAYDERQKKLALLAGRLGAGKSFSDVQAGA